MRKTTVTVGQKYNRLTVTERAGNDRSNHALWFCLCDCGKSIIVSSDKLKNGNTKSCGCLKSEKSAETINKYRSPHKSHGLSRTRIHNIWKGMKNRCYNKSNHKYKYYGGRGITVCDEWKNNFKAFYEWAMSHGYRDDLTIDRIKNDGNYEPSNCQWLTVQENTKKGNADRRRDALKEAHAEYKDILGY